MRFNQLTYKQKRRMLWGIAALIAIFCWVFSFSKTYLEILEYYRLTKLLEQSTHNIVSGQLVALKEVKMDSLIRSFTVDSLTFEENFLQNVSLAVQGTAVKISYDAYKSGLATKDGLVHKQLLIEGDYKNIVRVIQNLEQMYYLDRCHILEPEKCVISTVAYKGEEFTQL